MGQTASPDLRRVVVVKKLFDTNERLRAFPTPEQKARTGYTGYEEFAAAKSTQSF